MGQISKSKKWNWAISIKLSISTNLHAAIKTCGKISIPLLEAWNLVRKPRNSTRWGGGGFSALSTYHHFQSFKLSAPTVFQGGIMICSRAVTISHLGTWNLVPQAKNNTRVNFPACVCISSFPVNEAAHFYQVSWWYHDLK